MENGITIATDDSVAALIRAAERELVVLAPAVTETVAHAIADRWRHLGGSAVQVIIDSSAEVYRLGFGDEKGLQILEAASAEVGGILRKQPGTRIAIIVSDGRTLIYTAPARLIEAGPDTNGAANAILLGSPPPVVSSDLGQAAEPPKVSRAALQPNDIQQIKTSLTENPPQKFDIARRVRVFNAYFEFVELELLGTQIDKKTVQIPNHVLGVLDGRTREQLRANFRIVPDGDELSGEHLREARDRIAEQFLTVIPHFGVVVKRSNKATFEERIEELRSAVDAFGEDLRRRLQASIDRQRETLVEAFLPRLRDRPPREWMVFDNPPDDEHLRRLLERELKRAFGTADRLIRRMEVKLLFKGVTYEMLTNQDFMNACSKAGLDLERLHEEFEAAKAQPRAS